MRVLMTADVVGGVWSYSLALARALGRVGIEVELALMGPPPAEPPPDLTLFVRNFRLEWMENPWADVDAAGEWLLEIARERRPDVIHLNGYSHGALPFPAPKLIVAHSCVCSWWRAVYRDTAPPQWDEYRRRVQAGLHAADCVVAPSLAMRNDLEREHGRLSGVTQVIHNGAPDPCQGAGCDKQSANRVLCAGRFDDRAKNLAIIEAIAADIPWPVETAGEGGGMGRLTHDDVLQSMAGAAVFCHPALYEPFGLAPLEAALRGCALVLADIPSLREIWADAACFVDPRDPASLRAALLGIIGDPTERQRLSAAARARARLFSEEKQTADYAAVYRRLAE